MKLINPMRRVWRAWRQGQQTGQLDLSGDRSLEWGFVAGNIPDSPGTALDFGCGNSPLGLVAALKGYEVLAIDRQPVEWTHVTPRMRYVQTDIMGYDFGDQKFDVVLNCSTVEHVGLAGRYGSMADPDGDIKAMEILRRLMKPGARMLLTIPIGQDSVCEPVHRIYGAVRLPRLLSLYRIVHAQYWIKRCDRNVWIEAKEAEAVAIVGGPTLYGLGLFVLSPS